MSATEKMAVRMLGSNGLVARLTAELAQEQAAKHEAARATKFSAKERYLADKGPAEAAIKALDDKAAAAQKAAEQALDDYIKARERLDAIREAFTAVAEPADREMRTCCDPRIDTAAVELRALRDATPALARSWPDPKGAYQFSNGVRASNNNVEIASRIRALNEAVEELGRLKTNENVTDVGAEIDRIRNTIPAA